MYFPSLRVSRCLDFQILVASLVVLVFTAKGNVSQIAEALLKYGLLLERPGIMWKTVLNCDGLIYHNPHEGHAPLPATPSTSRWSSPAVSSKSVEVQRGAADAVFQNLRGEEDLPETSPGTYLPLSRDRLLSWPRYQYFHSALSTSKKGPFISVGARTRAHCQREWEGCLVMALLRQQLEEFSDARNCLF
jgi:hypothetical protein